MSPGRLQAQPAPSAPARGFTLVELLIAVSLLAILVALVVPSFGGEERIRLSAAALICSSDIEFAQVLAITQPDDPIVMRFDVANQRYWIALAKSPQDPIPHPVSGQPYLVRFGVGRGASAAGVRFDIEQMPAQTLTFESHGGLAYIASTPRIILTQEGTIAPRIVMQVNPTAGSVSQTYEQ